MTDIAKKIKSAGMVPVAVFNRKDDALAVAGLLLENGLPLIEVTLRT
ncbi:MAG TPA: keto-hydroxyglutarate-aldolase/keto-deoxy-phosphogluconate aldolase, partial [Spirochaetes bacterium]|nr:keto-hydroxyglutarate-aldolase/keto-deoxy-phosphogluconate aldolase [Spirochaetota bacterium]